MADELSKSELVRVRIVLLVMLAVLVLLGVNLWHIQVTHGSSYEDSLWKQSMRRLRLPAQRGRIFDRTGTICLADNRACYNLAISMETIRQRGKWKNTVEGALTLIGRLGAALGCQSTITERDIMMHVRKRLPLPFVVWQDIGPATLARFKEHEAEFKGVFVFAEPVRNYPQGPLAAHVLGYVGQADMSANDSDEDREPFHFNLPEMEGKRGMEAVCNELLSGEAGGQLLRIDASGFRTTNSLSNNASIGQLPMSSSSERAPRPGADILLTIDCRIQALAEQALNGETGGVVVVDVRNGEVLAMASIPGFNPNQFVPAISATNWNLLLQNPGRPLINRTVAEIYPPGSVFKPVVAIAALEAGKAGEGTTFNCPGYYALGQTRFRCWNANGHGTIALRKAIEQSCNSYFCALGMQCGIGPIHEQAQALGFGKKTGVECDLEAPGILPDNAWKRKVLHDGWRSGDTCNMSIGQGALSVTPLQVAMMVATIANGGRLYRPHLIREIREKEGSDAVQKTDPELVREMGWSTRTLNIVRGGMHDVIQAPEGTGQRARLDGIEMAGKTGTAEYGVKGQGLKHAWMMVFAPFDNPRYAAVIVLDNGISGGVSVAPRMRELMRGIFQEQEPEVRG